jgi:hypothetical protein
MDDLALLRMARRGIDPPLPRRRGNQHQTSGGAGTAQRLPHRPHRGRTAGRLQAEQRVRIEPVVGRRVFETDLSEVDLQLFGNQHRHRGIGALAHLDLRYDHRHLVVAGDADKGIGRENRVVRSFGGDHPRQPETQQQPAAGGAGLQDGAA